MKFAVHFFTSGAYSSHLHTPLRNRFCWLHFSYSGHLFVLFVPLIWYILRPPEIQSETVYFYTPEHVMHSFSGQPAEIGRVPICRTPEKRVDINDPDTEYACSATEVSASSKYGFKFTFEKKYQWKNSTHLLVRVFVEVEHEAVIMRGFVYATIIACRTIPPFALGIEGQVIVGVEAKPARAPNTIFPGNTLCRIQREREPMRAFKRQGQKAQIGWLATFAACPSTTSYHRTMLKGNTQCSSCRKTNSSCESCFVHDMEDVICNTPEKIR